jgi:hypothetical protein
VKLPNFVSNRSMMPGNRHTEQGKSDCRRLGRRHQRSASSAFHDGQAPVPADRCATPCSAPGKQRLARGPLPSGDRSALQLRRRAAAGIVS